MSLKQRLRKKFIFFRKKKYFPIRKNIFKPLISIISKRKIKRISLYYPSNHEFDTTKLIEILNKKKNLLTLLPIILKNRSMKFVKWELSDPLKINKYGFLEPVLNKKNFFPDLIILPVVAFDIFGNRLGYGKGYYDRFLGKYLMKNRSPIKIGLAFSFQKYKKIPTSNFDIKLDYVLTEKGIFKPK